MVWLAGLELPQLFKEIGICKQALTIIQDPHDIINHPDAKPLKVSRGEIIFDHVSFRYFNDQNLFRDKNIIIQAGQKVGLVGFSGSGKTTFVNLILRYFDVQRGCILIDDQDISRVTLDSLRENIGIIPQEPILFHRSIFENIHYGRLDATREEVLEAAKKAHCHEFVKKLPEKYDTIVGERGTKLSGGQRQRIAIARALLKNAPILILDEATSALDSVTEREIQDGLDLLMKNHTTLVVAHRLSTLSGMDRILVFKDGRIVEDGSHEELLRQGGHYAQMWNMQIEGFLPEEAL
jgi:ATP-binding cassette subfamily B protein